MLEHVFGVSAYGEYHRSNADDAAYTPPPAEWGAWNNEQANKRSVDDAVESVQGNREKVTAVINGAKDAYGGKELAPAGIPAAKEKILNELLEVLESVEGDDREALKEDMVTQMKELYASLGHESNDLKNVLAAVGASTPFNRSMW